MKSLTILQQITTRQQYSRGNLRFELYNGDTFIIARIHKQVHPLYRHNFVARIHEIKPPNIIPIKFNYIWRLTFPPLGFEFYEWMYNQKFDVTELSSTEVSIYLEYISVAPYILEEACDRRSFPYTTRQNRWKNGT